MIKLIPKNNDALLFVMKRTLVKEGAWPLARKGLRGYYFLPDVVSRFDLLLSNLIFTIVGKYLPKIGVLANRLNMFPCIPLSFGNS